MVSVARQDSGQLSSRDLREGCASGSVLIREFGNLDSGLVWQSFWQALANSCQFADSQQAACQGEVHYCGLQKGW